MASRRSDARAFVYRGGVRIAGTVLACDAAAGGELVFLSHAPSPGAKGRRALPRIGSGRRQLLATEETLALLGLGRKDTHALVVAPGRPFSLGELRLEVFAAGWMPGAASLLCERAGRRIVYAGPVALGAEVRAADALCIDARHTVPGLAFPPIDDALAAVGRAVREALGTGGAPVLRVESPVLALAVGAALAADRIQLRAHRVVVQAAAAYREAGLPAPPLARFAGRLGPGEVLIWPAAEKLPPRRRGDRAWRPIAVGPEPLAFSDLASPELPADPTVTLSTTADFAGLLRYVESTAAREVALINARGDVLTNALRARGIDAYGLGPPRQAELFAA
jgi:hypothetical protein